MEMAACRCIDSSRLVSITGLKPMGLLSRLLILSLFSNVGNVSSHVQVCKQAYIKL